MANTAGGYIVIGVEDGGTLRGLSDAEIALLDEAKYEGRFRVILGPVLSCS
jgi:predicted HTH transcriptional regulator